MVKVTIKWNAEEFHNVEVDVLQGVDAFKSQLELLTCVPPERQKIMIAGCPLKDGTDMSKLNLKERQKLLLVGTADKMMLNPPEGKTVFVEDLTPEQQAKLLHEKQLEVPPVGLLNMENTCYLNSVIQFLRPAKQFTAELQLVPGTADSTNLDVKLCNAFRTLFKNLESSGVPVPPVTPLVALRQKFPQFGRMNQGVFMQQDAEECLVCMLNVFKDRMPQHKMKELFFFELESRQACLEAEEPQQITKEDVSLLKCYIGNQSTPIDHLHEGLKLFLEEDLEKRSDVLDRNAKYRKVSRIATMPEYMVVHFVRFAWLGASGQPGSEAGRAKICRRIQFSKVLDIYDFSSDKLKDELKRARDILADRMESEASKRNKFKPQTNGSTGAPVESQSDIEDIELQSIQEHELRPIATGHYDLLSVVTHQGRFANRGHYIGWVKRDEERWYMFDDDKVTEHKWKDLDLSGGRSDYHIAVLLMFQKRYITPSREEVLRYNKREAEKQGQPTQ